MTVVVEKFFALLRIALSSSGEGLSVFPVCSEKEWLELQNIATKQNSLGLTFKGISRLPAEKRPPLGLLHQWACEAELIKGHNAMLNREAARLTDLFVAQGRHTAILKGPANARLYPDPFSRQGGDIDIWVSGGRDKVIGLLGQLGLDYVRDPKIIEAKHHVRLARSSQECDVEVHFSPVSKSRNPFVCSRLLHYLEDEIKNTERVPEGFYVPSLRFALVMQLSHIQKHFLHNGIGLRQLTDYFVLLQHSTQEDRDEVASQLVRLGLARTCAALMWTLGRVFGLEHDRMLCKPDKRRGRWLLEDVLAGGNFGFYSKKGELGFLRGWIWKRWRSIRFFAFDPVETAWNEFYYWKWFFRSIVSRIKLRRLSLKGLHG